MEKAVKAISAAVNLPLQIDSSDPVTTERALRIYNGKPMVNSVNGKEESIKAIMPIVQKYGGVLVGLCLDEEGIPPTAEQRIRHKAEKPCNGRTYSYNFGTAKRVCRNNQSIENDKGPAWYLYNAWRI